MQKRKLREDRKAAGAFRTIREVAEQFAIQQHVLRFWETKFTQIQPVKRSGGRRYYRPEDVAVVAVVHNLLHVQGYTIKGAQNLLRGKSKSKIIEMDLTVANKTAQISDVDTADQVLKTANAGNDNGSAKAGFSDKEKALLQATLSELKALKAIVES